MRNLSIFNKPLTSFALYLVIFTIPFIYTWIIADYILFFQEKSSLFVFSGPYLIDHLGEPGLPLIYLGRFLSTFFFHPVAGAFIISILISLLFALISAILRLLSGKNFDCLAAVAASLLFFLHSDYRYEIFNTAGLLIQLALFYLSLRLIKGWWQILLIPLLYFLSGGFTLIYVLIYILYITLYNRKGSIIKILVIVSGMTAMLLISSELLFFKDIRELLQFPVSLTNGTRDMLLIILACLIIVLPLIAKTGSGIILPGRFQFITYPSITLIVTIVTFSSAAFFRFDRKDKSYFEVEKLFYEGRFEEVIRYNRDNPSTNRLTIFLNNISLCETGKLNDQLFHTQQSADGSTLFLKWEMLGEVLKRGGYFYYTIGMINEAHRWAFENNVIDGYTPEGIKMLIKTELINGNYSTAEKYILLLRKSAFYRDEAKRFELMLYNDKAVESDPLLGEKRRIRLRNDFFSITDDPYVNLERILVSDSLNRKAFDYKLAFLLLRKDYEGITSQLPWLAMLGYRKIPANIEEALHAYELIKPGVLTDTHGMIPDPRTESRFDQFLQTFQAYGNDRKAAEQALWQKFGNTFWYWAFYR